MEKIMEHKAEDPVPNLTYGIRDLEGLARRHNHEIRSLTAWSNHSLLLEDLQKCNENKPSDIRGQLDSNGVKRSNSSQGAVDLALCARHVHTSLISKSRF